MREQLRLRDGAEGASERSLSQALFAQLFGSNRMHRPVDHEVNPHRVEEVDVIGNQDRRPIQRGDLLIQQLDVEKFVYRWGNEQSGEDVEERTYRFCLAQFVAFFSQYGCPFRPANKPVWKAVKSARGAW
jgi:hypothetical protein